MYLSSNDMMMAGIAANGRGRAKAAFARACLKEFEESDAYAEMIGADRYYANRGDILGRKRMVVGERGQMVEARNLANYRLPHPFLRRLTAQKVEYLLSRPFSLQTDDRAFAEAAGRYFTRDFMRLLKALGTAAVTHGLAWVQVYYDEEGILRFMRHPAAEIVPLWADLDHTRLDAALRVVRVEVLDGEKGETLGQIEYHDAEGVSRYSLEEDGGEGDGGGAAPIMGEADFTVNGEAQSWGRPPFVAFKYNADETPLLRMVKPLIDAYDNAVSDAANLIEDVPNAIKVVKGYSGTSPGEFIRNLAQYRTAFVEGDGDLSALSTPLDLTALEAHAARLKADIFEAGAGVDTQGIRLSNISSETLRMTYNALDMDCGGMAAEFSAAMEQLIGFILEDLLRRGEGDFTQTPYEIVWNTDTAVNQSETIENLVKSTGMLSRETILAQHPFVGDVGRELERIKREEEEADGASPRKSGPNKAGEANETGGDSGKNAAGGGKETGAVDDAEDQGDERGGADRAVG